MPTDRLDVKLHQTATHPSHTATVTLDRYEAQLVVRLISAAKHLRAKHGRGHASGCDDLIAALVMIDGLAPAPTPNASCVCTVCEDTHVMTLRDAEVPCTHCPTPCQECRVGGTGAYCAHTPCSCTCHTRTVR